ncbi:MAG: adenosylcobinamide amidohydrolase [Acidimicrobiia bacterium]|nr:adenosylcobinamide amidohydrolase [Acidimicrobiia bacterium]
MDALPRLVWRFTEPWRMLSSAAVGGGWGERCWVLNIEVPAEFHHTDLDALVHGVARGEHLDGDGIGLLTAADVRNAQHAVDGAVRATATVGLRLPTWAAAPPVAEGSTDPPWSPGTVNVVARVATPLSEAAMVNAVMVATEAKTQALFEAGVPGTGTATDAVVVACPAHVEGGPPLVEFCGPRSPWGAPLARAVYRAVAAGIPTSVARLRGEPPAPAGPVPHVARVEVDRLGGEHWS